MSAAAIFLLGLLAWPQDPPPAPSSLPFPEPQRSQLQSALREWISALESDSRQQVEQVGQFFLDAVGFSALVLPGPELDELGSRLRVSFSLLQRAAEDEGRNRILESGRNLSASFEALEAALDRDPLVAVDSLSKLLEEARWVPDQPAGSRIERISRRLGQPYTLRFPDRLPAGRPGPLLVLLGPPDALAELEKALPPLFLQDYLLLEADLSELSLAEIPYSGRLRLVDSLAEVFRICAVDRDRILLVGAGTGRDPSAVLTALLPHFFQGTVLLDDGTASAEKAGREPSVWLRRCQGNLDRPKLTPVHRGGDPAQAFAWLAGLAPRNPYPAVVEFDFLVPGAGRAFWVQGMAYDLVEHLERPAWIRVEADRESNTLRIEAESVQSIDLYLNDAILDLDRPILIQYLGSGRSYRFQARRSIATLLENFARNPDPRSVYPAMIRSLDLPADASR